MNLKSENVDDEVKKLGGGEINQSLNSNLEAVLELELIISVLNEKVDILSVNIHSAMNLVKYSEIELLIIGNIRLVDKNNILNRDHDLSNLIVGQANKGS